MSASPSAPCPRSWISPYLVIGGERAALSSEPAKAGGWRPHVASGDRRRVAGCLARGVRGTVGLDYAFAEQADRLRYLLVLEVRQLHVEDELVGAGLVVDLHDLATLLRRAHRHRADIEQTWQRVLRGQIQLLRLVLIVPVRLRHGAVRLLPGALHPVALAGVVEGAGTADAAHFVLVLAAEADGKGAELVVNEAGHRLRVADLRLVVAHVVERLGRV